MRWCTAIVASLALGGCVAHQPMQVDGDLHARATAVGDWDFEPRLCINRAYEGIKGVDLSSADGTMCVRFADHPREGPVVGAFVIDDPDGPVFKPEDCAEFKVRLNWTTDQYDTLYNMGGQLFVDCETEEGVLFGEATFDGCL